MDFEKNWAPSVDFFMAIILKRKIEAFHDYYILSFNEGNLNSLLFVVSGLGASFFAVIG